MAKSSTMEEDEEGADSGIAVVPLSRAMADAEGNCFRLSADDFSVAHGTDDGGLRFTLGDVFVEVLT